MTEREQVRFDIKRQLNSYRGISAEIRQLQDELKRLEALMASPSGPSLDGMPRGQEVSDPVARAVVRIVTLQERYQAQVERLTAAQEMIEDIIEGLEPTERRLARFRYIDGLTWEDVCEKMSYSWTQTHRIHGRMLSKLIDAELERRKAPE